MKQHKLLVFLLAYITLSFFYTSVWAAEIHVEKKINVVFRGEIKKGDAERFAEIVGEMPMISRLSIDSTGGDLTEAMRIAELISKLHLTIEVAKGGHCVSACFFIFIEGFNRIFSSANDDGTLPTSKNNIRGYLGIHRPYLKSPQGDVASVKRQESIMRNVKTHLATKMIPQYLIDEMMSRPSNDIYWLKENDSEQIGEYGAGNEEALISKCGYKRFKQSNAENWSDQRYSQMYNCIHDYWENNYSGEHFFILTKLKIGWRPWSGWSKR